MNKFLFLMLFFVSSPMESLCTGESDHVYTGEVGIANLMSAAASGRLDEVKRRLGYLGINDKDQFGDTVLVSAAVHGYPELVRYLLTVPNIDVNAINDRKNTALITAIIGFEPEPSQGAIDAIKTLLKDPRIRVNVRDSRGWTALSWVVFEILRGGSTKVRQNALQEIKNLLLAKGATE